MGRSRTRPGHRHHAVPVGPQHPGRRGPGVLQLRPVPGPPARPARRPRPRPAAGRRSGPDGRGLHGRHPRPSRRHHPGRSGRRQGHPGRGYPAAAGGGKRRRHVPARRRPRLRPAHQPGPVPSRVGTGRQPAAPRRRYHRAGRVRPARPDHRRRTRADDGRRRGRLPRAHPGRHGHAADGGGPRAAPRAEPPHPRGPHHLGHRLRWPRRHHRRRHAGQLRRPDHLHPQRPQCRGRRARPGPGQRRLAPHRSHHPERPACPPGSGCSPGNRAAPVDRPTLPVQFL